MRGDSVKHSTGFPMPPHRPSFPWGLRQQFVHHGKKSVKFELTEGTNGEL